MAKLYSKLGNLIRFLKTESEEEQFGDPLDFDEMLEFDIESNPEAVGGIDTAWDAHTLTGGVLSKDDVEVPINPPGETYLDREFLRNYWQQVNAYIDQLTSGIDAWDGLTAAQKQTWFLNNFDDLLRMVRGVMRFVRWLMKVVIKRSL